MEGMYKVQRAHLALDVQKADLDPVGLVRAHELVEPVEQVEVGRSLPRSGLPSVPLSTKSSARWDVGA